MIQAVADFVHVNESRGLEPGFVPTLGGHDGSEAGRERQLLRRGPVTGTLLVVQGL